MEQMTQANEQQLEQKKITKKELSKAFWIYQLGCELSNSYERLQSLVFCASMIPAIKKLYADDEEQQREALKRHLNFFNTEGTVGASIQGIAIAMEEEKSNGAAISDTAITSIKTGLMGPLAGIGDSIIWAALMPLIISIFIPMAKGGNVTGSIGPLVLYTAITLYISWTLVNKSYTLGRNSILSLLKDGKIKQVIYSANVLGMMMMGALSASYVKIASPMTFKVTGGATIVLQDILDQIMKGLLPLAAVMAIYFFMVKKGPRYGIIIGTIVLVSLVTSFFGLL
ncbi:PTS system mannose/fructose/sorbose family transporter subunit IID [Enterococcus faecalis]|uniref:PTS system mannose/fructose/sorbose family transporter subunit IID n=1 Tax=Enterococcus faecalis TaxID=1351 RepID=UPI000E1622C2|nr:PTS system mannose/fructose/sorbose family transporter subunit IID [Enterococcus faecalis]EGO2609906.1 PTS system mannose/fructose/sorbose family transporter subunit IID [Enterococcus faecalis]EGO8105104.1 PTS system mannose/fructose/sorbose family transporter subunit IID [Enterococcus faecalis]EGO8175381.1 PTS system mannose/fructose/sorbose family transporter subunit IID [Enterococcus faecalis]EGS8305830.1 PTS system mannose/fructose/sorbose family transporter subunit IID [Enterococcus fae